MQRAKTDCMKRQGKRRSVLCMKKKKIQGFIKGMTHNNNFFIN